MHPTPRIDRRDFTSFPHLNPIDPAQYPSESEPVAEERPLPTETPGSRVAISSGRRDSIVPIAPSEWADCFDRLSRSHEGWLATLAVSDAPASRREEARDLPFAGMVQEPGRKAVSIRLGALEHFVRDPSAVRLRLGPDGAEKALEIESADATRTVLEFRSALPTEMVDGIAPFPTPD